MRYGGGFVLHIRELEKSIYLPLNRSKDRAPSVGLLFNWPAPLTIKHGYYFQLWHLQLWRLWLHKPQRFINISSCGYNESNEKSYALMRNFSIKVILNIPHSLLMLKWAYKGPIKGLIVPKEWVENCQEKNQNIGFWQIYIFRSHTNTTHEETASCEK